MKTHFRFYNSIRTAKIGTDNKGAVIALTKGKQFQLGEFKGRPVVILDGIRYPISPKMLPELKKRSTVAQPSKEYVKSVQQFDKLGHTLLKWVQHWISTMSKDMESGFKNGQAYALFDDRGTKYVLYASPTGLYASVYAPEKQQVHVAKLNDAIHKIANRLKKDFGADVGEFKDLVAHVANVTLPWGVFSGTIYQHSAKWSIK